MLRWDGVDSVLAADVEAPLGALIPNEYKVAGHVKCFSSKRARIHPQPTVETRQGVGVGCENCDAAAVAWGPPGKHSLG